MINIWYFFVKAFCICRIYFWSDSNKKTTYHPEIYGPFDNIPDIDNLIQEKVKTELKRLANNKMEELSKDITFINLLKKKILQP